MISQKNWVIFDLLFLVGPRYSIPLPNKKNERRRLDRATRARPRSWKHLRKLEKVGVDPISTQDDGSSPPALHLDGIQIST